MFFSQAMRYKELSHSPGPLIKTARPLNGSMQARYRESRNKIGLLQKTAKELFGWERKARRLIVCTLPLMIREGLTCRKQPLRDSDWRMDYRPEAALSTR